jgi:hypothetical protein
MGSKQGSLGGQIGLAEPAIRRHKADQPLQERTSSTSGPGSLEGSKGMQGAGAGHWVLAWDKLSMKLASFLRLLPSASCSQHKHTESASLFGSALGKTLSKP